MTGVVTCTVFGTTVGGPATGTSVGAADVLMAAGFAWAKASAAGTKTTACAMPRARAETTATRPHSVW